MNSDKGYHAVRVTSLPSHREPQQVEVRRTELVKVRLPADEGNRRLSILIRISALKGNEGLLGLTKQVLLSIFGWQECCRCEEKSPKAYFVYVESGFDEAGAALLTAEKVRSEVEP